MNELTIIILNSGLKNKMAVVIPAEAGTHLDLRESKMGPGFRRDDGNININLNAAWNQIAKLLPTFIQRQP